MSGIGGMIFGIPIRGAIASQICLIVKVRLAAGKMFWGVGVFLGKALAACLQAEARFPSVKP